jgi:uncharacterized MAPEG superfamily protein
MLSTGTFDKQNLTSGDVDMTTELTYLTYTAIYTGIMWLPYILHLILVRGLIKAISYPDDRSVMAPWAVRMRMAHTNNIETLMVFAPLVVIAHLTDANTPATATASMIFFFSRIVHNAGYTLAIPGLRTVAFFASVGAYLTIGFALLG